MARKYAMAIEEYGRWKSYLKVKYLKKFPKREAYINQFIKHVAACYDSTQRAYFPSSMMWYLFEKRRRVIKRNQHFWIAFIGQKGGEGKSTLAKQVLHFLDHSMDCERISLTYDEFIESIYNAKAVKKLKYPCVLLDEPENKTHSNSAKGRKFRDILEKVRQMNLFVGVCANSWSSVPAFIQERLTAVCFLNSKHRFTLWDKDKDPTNTVIDEIKEKWATKRHKVFKSDKMLNRAMFENVRFSSKCPFDDTQYLVKKEQDLIKDIGSYILDSKPKPKKTEKFEGEPKQVDKTIIKEDAPDFKMPDRGLKVRRKQKW